MFSDRTLILIVETSFMVTCRGATFTDVLNPPDRHGIIDRRSLMEACGYSDYQKFAEQHQSWVEDALRQSWSREGHWTESIAVGSSSFIEETKSKLGCRARGRSSDEQKDGPCFLKEEGESYTAGFCRQK